MTASPLWIWGISALSLIGIIVHPGRVPGWVWAATGGALLVGAGLLPPERAWAGIASGGDVYLFLTGMMLLAETARQQGLFDWLAALAARWAAGSARRLFVLVYLVGIVVTAFLSNDATSVVLTPAVAAVARAAGAPSALPYLLICAFIANAASFLLPIANPANLVIGDGAMPPLDVWLRLYGPPSLAAIAATFAALWLTQRRALRQPLSSSPPRRDLGAGGRLAGAGIIVTAGVLMAASAVGWPLGAVTCATGVTISALVLIRQRQTPGVVLRAVSWSVLPLVAGLFVLVEAVSRTPLLDGPVRWLTPGDASPVWTAALAGGAVALICNLVNNLPAGLAAASVIHAAHPAPVVTAAVLIGVDLGPNLSVTGSLATILWLTALRREGIAVSAGHFLKVGALVMPPALILAIAALFL